MCVFFFFLLFSSVTKDEHLVVDQRGKKEEKKQTEWILSRSRISPSFFSSLQVLDPEADVPRRLGPGHRVEGCGRSAELVLGLNLEVGGGMEVRVTVRLGSPLGQRVQPPQGARAKVATVYLHVQSQRCHNGMHATRTLICSYWTTGFIVRQSLSI